MKEFKYTITDPVGLHARPAGILAKEAKNYECEITVIKGDKSAKAGALMKLMALGVKQGDEVTVRVDGPDEDKAYTDMEEFFKTHF